MARHLVCTSNLEKAMSIAHMPANTLARAIGVSNSMIRKYMKGESEPSIYRALLIANVLLCDVHKLWKAEVIELDDLT